LTFKVMSGGSTLVNKTFTSFASADAYFTDDPLNLGNFAAGTNSLTISYSLTCSSAKGADFSYLIATKPTVALGLNATAPQVRFGHVDRADIERRVTLAARAAGLAVQPRGASAVAALRPTMVGSALTTTAAAHAASTAARRSIGEGASFGNDGVARFVRGTQR
jgi:hypothetical protein